MKVNEAWEMKKNAFVNTFIPDRSTPSHSSLHEIFGDNDCRSTQLLCEGVLTYKTNNYKLLRLFYSPASTTVFMYWSVYASHSS
jgi:hypothetical protein